ncbi:coiled-coil domain-containing protein 107 isoform X1 [Carlito syrichta]|uniref:Coiled-coil domain-containing protein 107 isoform X1 n=1 Tax=Carlito syrichta TaxID=1868482 RepID=A0A3Q0E378_CARSF|nr:coiled-coil domain-containing protein 107 isoform X1 [Carlito syrichta]
MAGAVPLSGVLGLLLVSALPGVLGDRASPDLRAHPGNPAGVGPGATEPRRRPPLKDQRERTRAGALPLGALYTAAVVAFVLYKCLQGKDEAAVLQEEAGKKQSLQSEQQLTQLTQQLAQTEQHLHNLMAQLDPLFEHVTTLAGAQQDLLNGKLWTIHQLLKDSKTSKGVTLPEPGKGLGGESGRGGDKASKPGTCLIFPLTEASTPFPHNLCIEEDEEETGDNQVWEEPVHWSTETRNPATSWEVEQGLRRRCRKAVAKGPSQSPSQEGGTTAEGLIKQSLFL